MLPQFRVIWVVTQLSRQNLNAIKVNVTKIDLYRGSI